MWNRARSVLDCCCLWSDSLCSIVISTRNWEFDALHDNWCVTESVHVCKSEFCCAFDLWWIGCCWCSVWLSRKLRLCRFSFLSSNENCIQLKYLCEIRLSLLLLWSFWKPRYLDTRLWIWISFFIRWCSLQPEKKKASLYVDSVSKLWCI
jgi:hypothetical protein